MKRWLSLVPLVLAAVSMGTAVFLYRENRELRRELAHRSDNGQTADRVQVSGARATNPDTPAQNDAGSSAMAGAEVAPPANPSTQNGRGGRGNFRRGGGQFDRGNEAIARMLSDPEARTATLSRLKAQVDRTYGDLFVRLGLDELQVEALRTVLAERQLMRMEAGVLERSAETDQARAEAQAYRDQRMAALDANINAILGPNGVQLLQEFQASTPQRAIVEDIARRASYAGAPLSADASDQLVQLIRQIETEMPVSRLARGGWQSEGPNTASVSATDGGARGGQRPSLTQETVNTYLREKQLQNQEILSRAQSILTQTQLEALADRQIEEMEQLEAQLNFALRNPDMRVEFGGGGFGGGGFGGFGGRGGGGRAGRGGAAP